MIKVSISDLLEIHKPGVYALVNESEKKVHIGYGVSLLTALERLVKDSVNNKELEFITKDKDLLTLYFIHVKRDNIKFKATREINKYLESGYSLYVPGKRLPVSYKVREDIVYYLYQGVVTPFIVVYLVSARNDKLLVAVFEDKGLAADWLGRHYPGGKVNSIVYNNSPLNKIIRDSEPISPRF